MKDEPDVQINTREQLQVMLWFLCLKTVPGVLSVTPGISSKSFGRTHAAGQKRSCCMKSCLYLDFPTQAEQMYHRKWARKGKHKTLKNINSLDKNNIKFRACYNFSTLTSFLTWTLHFILDSRVLAVVSDFQTAGPQGSKQSVTVGFVWQVLLTWYLLKMDENIHRYRGNSWKDGGRKPETRNLDRRKR